MIPVARPWLTEAEALAAAEVVRSGWVIQGPKVAAFEEQFAEYVGSRYAVAVSSGTAALHLSLVVLGIEEGDEVICPSLSYIATANSIWYTGARPVFADVSPTTMNIDPADIEKKITPKTKAIMAVHQVGLPAPMEEIAHLAKRYGLLIIEDAACAIGSEINGKKIGASGNLTAFSFHPRKIITTGDGGMITLNDEARYNRLKRLRQHGMFASASERHHSKGVMPDEHVEIGYNYRMTDIQAAVGIEQLKKLTEILQGRREVAEYYNTQFAAIDWIELPAIPADALPNYQSYIIKLNASAPLYRDQLIAHLAVHGISTRKGIMTAHREKAYLDAGYSLVLPNSEIWSDNSICLPLFYPIDGVDYKKIVAIIQNI